MAFVAKTSFEDGPSPDLVPEARRMDPEPFLLSQVSWPIAFWNPSSNMAGKSPKIWSFEQDNHLHI